MCGCEWVCVCCHVSLFVSVCLSVGSPIKFNVTDVSRVTAKGRGLSSVVCRQPASFAVSTASASAAGAAALKLQDLDVAILGRYFVLFSRCCVFIFIYLFIIYYTVYTHVKSFTIVKNRKCGQVTSHCRKAQLWSVLTNWLILVDRLIDLIDLLTRSCNQRCILVLFAISLCFACTHVPSGRQSLHLVPVNLADTTKLCCKNAILYFDDYFVDCGRSWRSPGAESAASQRQTRLHRRLHATRRW